MSLLNRRVATTAVFAWRARVRYTNMLARFPSERGYQIGHHLNQLDVADSRRAILTARHDGRIVGYAMLIRGDDRDVELSKLYLLPGYHGTGAAAALMHKVLATAADWGALRVWLGVNQKNQRAQRFYAKTGFKINGTRTFRLGAHHENDYVMVRELV